MKLAMLSLIFICCTLFGLCMDNDERRRLKEMEQFIYLFEMLKGEIDYTLTPLISACYKVAGYVKGGVSQTFYFFSEQLEVGSEQEFGAMWHSALERGKYFLHLKPLDYEILEGFGSSDGLMDKYLQKRQIELVVEQLEHERKKGQEKYEKCTKLNRYLGMLIGGALVIFLI